MKEVIQISREELYQPAVDKTLAHQKALVRQSEPVVELPVSALRSILLSNLFYTPFAGLLGALTTWLILEPWLDDLSVGGAFWFLFPMTATFIVLFIFISEGIASRRIRGNVGRWMRNVGLTVLLSFLAFIPAGLLSIVMATIVNSSGLSEDALRDIRAWPASLFIAVVIWRSLGWAVIGGALGLGMNLMRSTAAQRRASVMGGVVGGALGGLFFDPISRFLLTTNEQAHIERFIGLCTVGICVGIFVALSERLGREGWVCVRTGPLRGKDFILYHNPTVIGSSPNANIYLFKDPKIAPEHASLYRVGSGYELVDTSSVSDASPIFINGAAAHRRRLTSGDQITIGDTILDFEERARKRAAPPVIKEANA